MSQGHLSGPVDWRKSMTKRPRRGSEPALEREEQRHGAFLEGISEVGQDRDHQHHK